MLKTNSSLNFLLTGLLQCKQITDQLKIMRDFSSFNTLQLRRENTTAVLAPLHRPQVTFQVYLKFLLLYKIVKVQGPSYTANSLIYYLPIRILQSSSGVYWKFPAEAAK